MKMTVSHHKSTLNWTESEFRHHFFMNLEHSNISQKNQVVEVVVASETFLASFDHELGASRHQKKRTEEKAL
jgi:hypothetical protein